MYRRDLGYMERQIASMAFTFTDKPDGSILVMCPKENPQMVDRIVRTLRIKYGIFVNVEKVSNSGKSYGHIRRPLPEGSFSGYRFTVKSIING